MTAEPGGRGGRKPRRVLILVENLPVPFDRRVWLEATTLARAGYDVSVICPKGKGYEAPRERLDGVDIYRHGLPLEASGALGYLMEYGAALWHELRLATGLWLRGGFDLIHACNPPDLLFLVALPFKLMGVRFIYDQHDLCPELFVAKYGRKGWAWRLLSLAETLTFRLADVVISTNESYRAVALGRGRKPRDRVYVVRSGPDLALWPKAPTGDPAWRRGRKHVVGYLGVMGEQEGIDLLLEAAAVLVHQQKRDIQFVLVGDGSARAELERLAGQLGLTDHVTFTGRLPHEALLACLGEADVCVNPDRPSELNDKSTMNKIVEYMALGKPIVQFDLTEGRVSAQEASLYARPGDVDDFARSIGRLLDAPKERARMGKFGRTRVERELSWEYQTPILLAAYEQAFSARRPRAAD